MAWILRLMMSVCCVVGFGAIEDSVFKTAIIAVSVVDQTSGAELNTSYITGIFGSNSLTVPVSGQLVHVLSEGDVNHGCSNYIHDLPSHDWVALIERGVCLFDQKIRLATKQHNASAVLVYNNEFSTHVVINSWVKDEVYVSVSQNVGRDLALMVDNGLHVRVNITAMEISASSHLASSHVISLLFSILAGVLPLTTSGTC